MKRPSFQFYPADWKGSFWVSYDSQWAARGAEDRPACYVIYIDGKLAYVGQTTSLRKRLYTHKISRGSISALPNSVWGQFESITVKARYGVKYGDWAMREARLINRLQPPLNCVGSIRKRGSIAA